MSKADKWTDAQLAKLEAKIKKEYAQASKDIQKMADEYFAKFKKRWEVEYKAYQEGKYTKAEFEAWERAQLGRGKHWKRLQKQMADRLAKASKICAKYANDLLPSVYKVTSNEIAKIAQASAMSKGIVGIDFELIDENTVKRLMRQSRDVKGNIKLAINLPRINQWNMQKLQNALLQGILSGDSIDKIADRFQKVADMDRSQAIRSARTAVTGAQNQGKQDRFDSLAEQGCIISKVWVATGDPRTRDAHRDADGQEVDASEPFEVGGEEMMYPGDPSGSGWNIYNCRCTMQTGQIKFKSTLSDEARERANIRVH